MTGALRVVAVAKGIGVDEVGGAEKQWLRDGLAGLGVLNTAQTRRSTRSLFEEVLILVGTKGPLRAR